MMRGLIVVASLALAACSASPPITEAWFAGRWQSSESELTSVVEANGSTLWSYVGGGSAQSGADALIIEQFRIVAGAGERCMTLRTNGAQRVMRLRFRGDVPAAPEIVAASRGQLAPAPDREYRACRDGETLRLGTLSGDGQLEFVRYTRIEAAGALPLAPPSRSDLENMCGLTCNARSADFNACFTSCRSAVDTLPPLQTAAMSSSASPAGAAPVADELDAPQAPSPEGEQNLAPPAQEQQTFRDCAECPEMVVIAGYPLHFAAGRYEVTFDEWDACVAAGGCNGYTPSDNGWGRGARPVINVSWHDARAYAQWLSQRTGGRYSLLTGEQWRFAARAETSTRYSWGDESPVCDPDARNGANFDACEDNQTRPVGAFQPNAWGLFDVHGNVWEWVYWCPYPGCTSEAYVLGGAWNANAAHVRTDSQATGRLDRRYTDIGFRVAKILQN